MFEEMLNFRCVPDNQRSLATGIRSLIGRCFGNQIKRLNFFRKLSFGYFLVLIRDLLSSKNNQLFLM